jgi:chromosome segregation ATPase
MKPRRPSLPRQLLIGLLLGILIMPPRAAQAQWTVFDPAQYTLQVTKRVEEASRWIQHYTNLVQQLTTLGGVLKAADDLVAKQKHAITTMSNIGRTVRASYQLKDQLEAIVISRMRALKSIESRLRNGVFDPEADFRDFEQYLRTSIGRTSQDSVANLERLIRMDNTLQRMQKDLESARARKAWAETHKAVARGNLEKEEANNCAECVARINQELAECEQVLSQAESQIARLEDEIAERYKKYNIEMEERIRFGQQVQSMNKAWSRFNDSLDELQRTLRKY